MKRNGFTLLELLAVLALVAIIGATTITLFSRSTADTANDDLANKYRQIQQAAVVYVDLNDSWLAAFTTSDEIYVRLGELQGTNYISADIVDPTTGQPFPSSYLVKIYKDSDASTGEDYVDTCIIAKEGSNTICIANSDGEPTNCCNGHL